MRATCCPACWSSSGVAVVGLLTSGRVGVAGRRPRPSQRWRRSRPSAPRADAHHLQAPTELVHRAGADAVRAQLLELPRRRRLGHRRAPNLEGLGPATVDFWVSTGRMPLGGCQHPTRPEAAPLQPQADPRDRRLRELARPAAPDFPSGIPVGEPGDRPTSPRATRCSSSTAPAATPSPAPVTRWPTGSRPRRCTRPTPTRSSRPSAPARPTCPTSARATSRTSRWPTSSPT